MKTKIELDEDDMKKIIAEYFSVNEDRATVSAKEMCVGYGMMERRESVPYCIVEKSD